MVLQLTRWMKFTRGVGHMFVQETDGQTLS